MTSHRRGFTLLEVTVALTVVAIGFAALLQLSARSVAAGERQRNATRIAAAGRALLDETRRASPPIGSSDGTDPHGLHWTREITATEHPRLRLVRVRIAADDGAPPTAFMEVIRVAAP